ncbi:MAG: DUF1592 domain-containing protein [Planctomycetales bacterium]|nr:DUF1592 domain-containing protein [Planctomycetales bacterium]
MQLALFSAFARFVTRHRFSWQRVLWSVAILARMHANCVAEDEPLPTTDSTFQDIVSPFLNRYCVACHNTDEPTSGVRLDHLTGEFADEQLRFWEGTQRQLSKRSMPPKDEPQPTSAERQRVIAYIEAQLAVARRRPAPKNGQIRRLTVAQYRNTLRELLLLDEDFTETFPADAVSRDGFVNTVETLSLSPRHLETFLHTAVRAIDAAVVDTNTPPTIECFQVDFGRTINTTPCPDKLILGANSHLLDNRDFVVDQPKLEKPFLFQPFQLRTHYRFIEGYRGNDTVRGWREFDSIYHAVYACMRGSEGYPKGLAYQTVPQGLLLRPAIPSAELFQIESTYGPKANFKISVRELPDEGEFRVTVTAAKYDDGLLLDDAILSRTAEVRNSDPVIVSGRDIGSSATVKLPTAGIYRIDLIRSQTIADPPPELDVQLFLAKREFSSRSRSTEFLVVRLAEGDLTYRVEVNERDSLERVDFVLLDDAALLAQEFARFERRAPLLGVHLGLRRDCGSTLTPVGSPQRVDNLEWAEFVFQGAIRDYPSPDVEADNVNYLAGLREIGVRSEYTDGRDMPRLAIRSVRFEGPFFPTWPPPSHQQIFGDSTDEAEQNADELQRAAAILERFASRAFRRPTTASELTMLKRIYVDARNEGATFSDAIKNGLVFTLTSPQFLFLIENSATPAAEPLDDYELAAKLAYFLWNGPPDSELTACATAGTLRASLDEQLERMIADDRFSRCMQTFTRQWLNLEKFAVLEPDRDRFPQLTRDARHELENEPGEFLQYLIRENLPVSSLLDSSFVVANEVVADYYGLGDLSESGFQFKPLTHQREDLGGVLTQAAILAGLSDGREPNPVKRGAWFARKIIAEPPDDPPPNVPALSEDLRDLPLRVRLERHRNQTGCAQCHAKIDPWGIAFEQYSAAGRWRTDTVDAHTRLPDQTEVNGMLEFKQHLIKDRLDQVTFSFLKHLTTYASGRKLHFSELESLRDQQLNLRDRGYPMRDLLRSVILSPPFMEK